MKGMWDTCVLGGMAGKNIRTISAGDLPLSLSPPPSLPLSLSHTPHPSTLILQS